MKVRLAAISIWPRSKFHLLWWRERWCLAPSVFSQRLTQGRGNHALRFAKANKAEPLPSAAWGQQLGELAGPAAGKRPAARQGRGGLLTHKVCE